MQVLQLLELRMHHEFPEKIPLGWILGIPSSENSGVKKSPSCFQIPEAKDNIQYSVKMQYSLMFIIINFINHI
jgi:hypothetical protein